jgi:tight adherence protein C
MALILGLALATAAFLTVRAFLVEGKVTTSAWRARTLGTATAPEPTRRARRPGSAVLLRSKGLLERLARSAPRLHAPADRVVARAGLQGKITGAWLVGVSAVVGVAVLLFFLLTSSGSGFTNRDLAMIPAVALLGSAIPWVLVKGRADRRQHAIERALPDMLDLLVVSIEAGLALEGALQRVTERGVGALSEEIRRTLNEISLGRRRYEALIALAERTQVPALQTLVNAMNQAERSGMQLGPVLRAQAEQLRTRRRQQAQERALKAPVKMLIPLAIFIFPAMFLVILGPAAIPFIT